MSDTPRVDAVHANLTKKSEIVGRDYVDMCDLAIDLERELAAKSAEATRLRDALEHLIEWCDISDDCRYGTLSTSFVRDVAQEALALAKEQK
jgi:hypothetical protein